MENQKEVEFDLLQMLRHLLRRVWIIILATVIFAGAGYIYTKKTTVPVYTAKCQVFVYSANINDQVGYNEMLMTMFLRNECKTLITGRTVTKQVVEELDLKASPDSVGASIRVTGEDDSRVLEVTYTDTNPKRAAAILEKVCEVAQVKVKDKLKVDDFVVLDDQIEVPTAPTDTSTTRNTLLAAAAGFVLSAGILIVLYLMDDTIRNEDDVDRFLGLSTLTTIPISVDLSTDGKVSSKRKKKSQVWLKKK